MTARMLGRFLAAYGAAFLAAANAQEDVAPGRVLVRLRQASGPAAAQSFAAAQGLKLERVLRRLDVCALSLPAGADVAAVARRLAADARVEFAEPDRVRYACHTPSDPYYAGQWDMEQIGMPTLWDYTRGSNQVIVAIVDTGIDLDHPDLVDRLLTNPLETPNNGLDDDGNGYVDDYMGYDFAGEGNAPPVGKEDSWPDDTMDTHGTHVSGTVGATQDNGIGISGIAPGVRLLAVRVLGGAYGSGYSSDIAEGVVYATDRGAKVINMSMAGTGFSRVEFDALHYAWANGVVVVAAAGNNGNMGNPLMYPAACMFTMSVGATDSSSVIANFSTYNEFVEVSAPGVNILSTIEGGTYDGDGWSGTSMASPHVAGLAALLFSLHPGVQNWQIRAMLQDAVIDRGTLGWDAKYGYGRIFAAALAEMPVPAAGPIRFLLPPDGASFRHASLVQVMWSPVPGAANYRLSTQPPVGPVVVGETSLSYGIVPPSTRLPRGWYTMQVEALDGGGGVLSSGTIRFRRR